MKEFSTNTMAFDAMVPHHFVQTYAMFGQKIRPCILHCLRIPFDCIPLVAYDEDGFETSTGTVWPVYQAEAFYVGHIILWTGRADQFSCFSHPGAMCVRPKGDAPKSVKMLPVQSNDNLIVLDDRRQRCTVYLSPQEVKRDDWN